MGTRNLTIIQKDNKTKIAKYGQWDGDGVGPGILAALKTLGVENVRKAVDNVRELTKEEIEEVNKLTTEIEVMTKYGFKMSEPEWKVKFPWLSRDCAGDELLKYIVDQDPENPLGLITYDVEFVADSLFCEWCYVVDFDKNTFEIYKGFNTEVLDETERFACYNGLCEDKSYKPVKFLASFSLYDLPENIDQLYRDEDCEDEDEDETKEDDN